MKCTINSIYAIFEIGVLRSKSILSTVKKVSVILHSMRSPHLFTSYILVPVLNSSHVPRCEFNLKYDAGHMISVGFSLFISCESALAAGNVLASDELWDSCSTLHIMKMSAAIAASEPKMAIAATRNAQPILRSIRHHPRYLRIQMKIAHFKDALNVLIGNCDVDPEAAVAIVPLDRAAGLSASS